MTEYLRDNASFRHVLKALSTKQLEALENWQDERMSCDPDKEADCLMRKQLIDVERRRREVSKNSEHL